MKRTEKNITYQISVTFIFGLVVLAVSFFGQVVDYLPTQNVQETIIGFFIGIVLAIGTFVYEKSKAEKISERGNEIILSPLWKFIVLLYSIGVYAIKKEYLSVSVFTMGIYLLFLSYGFHQIKNSIKR